jgi:hypothetical protein
MRPRLILLPALALGTIASSAYILIRNENKRICCEKKIPCKKQPGATQSGSPDNLFNTSFDHLLVSVVK